VFFRCCFGCFSRGSSTLYQCKSTEYCNSQTNTCDKCTDRACSAEVPCCEGYYCKDGQCLDCIGKDCPNGDSDCCGNGICVNGKCSGTTCTGFPNNSPVEKCGLCVDNCGNDAELVCAKYCRAAPFADPTCSQSDINAGDGSGVGGGRCPGTGGLIRRAEIDDPNLTCLVRGVCCVISTDGVNFPDSCVPAEGGSCAAAPAPRLHMRGTGPVFGQH
jgi:hypothetical protein